MIPSKIIYVPDTANSIINKKIENIIPPTHSKNI